MLAISLLRRISTNRSILVSFQGRWWKEKVSTRLFSIISNNDDNEVLDEEGEWAGCTKRFLKPLRISTRGPGTSCHDIKKTVD